VSHSPADWPASGLTTLKQRHRRVANLLLRLYPDRFRRDYGAEALRQLESDLAEAAQAGLLRGVAERVASLLDFALAGIAERAAAFRGTGTHHRPPRRASLMNSLIQDARFALRGFVRQPVFTLVAVASLALGVGGNSAIFSVANGILFHPLPYAAPDRVVQILGTRQGELTLRNVWLAYPEIDDIRAASDAFAEISAMQWWVPILYGAGEPTRVFGQSVSASFFRIFGLEPALGRFFTPEEERLDHAPVVVLSHGLWQQRFGGDPDIVGRALDFNGVSYSVVGVAPQRFVDPFGGQPLMWRSRPPDWDATRLARFNHSWRAIGRLEQGVTLEQAQADVDRIWNNFRSEYPNIHTDDGAQLRPAKDWMVGGVRAGVLVLLGAVGLLLLIACANVASLFLTRTLTRSREVALRSALGAGRGRIVRQLVTEVCLLFLIGGAVGLPVAWLGIDSLSALGAQNLPRFAEIRFDWTVLGFALGISLLTGLLFGVTAAYPSAAADPAATLQSGGRSSSGDRKSQRLRGTLVVAEIAIALVLLAGGGLLLKSLWNIHRVDPGFRAENVLTLRVYPRSGTYTEPEEVTYLYRQLTSRLASLPGVTTAGAINFLPMWGGQNCEFVWRDDRPLPTTTEELAQYDGPRCLEVRVVTPGYFRAMGIPVVRGRGFAEQDNEDAPPVAVISQAAAELGFRGEEPLGKRVTMYETRDHLPNVSREVVGVVADVRQTSLGDEGVPAIYFAHAQAVDPARRGVMTLVARTERDPTASADLARAAVWEVDDNITIDFVQSMTAVKNRTVTQPRFRTTLVLIFGGMALLLAAIGVAGVAGYTVSQRIPEIGLRIALGARHKDIYATVMRQGIRLTALGLVLGVCGALAATRVLSGLLYGVAPTDPTSLGLASLLLALIALVAVWLPARRALRVDPVKTLNAE
jgi:putative ABC transport system permease protein